MFKLRKLKTLYTVCTGTKCKGKKGGGSEGQIMSGISISCLFSSSDDFCIKYCITGIFPGTFIYRKLVISTFSRFLISRLAYGCTDIKFTENATECIRF